MAGWRVEADLPTHAFHQFLGDGQAEAGAAFLARIGRIRLRELLEDAAAELCGNALALVNHADPHAQPAAAHAHLDLAAGRREFGSIGQQVGEHLLQIAHQNSRRLGLLINDLLDMEKLVAGKMTFHLSELNLLAQLEEALLHNQPYADEHGISWHITQPLAGIRVRADSQRLQQVLANLLSNAAKFSPAGSQVEVRMSRGGLGVRVSVIDQGPGIPAEFQGRIFSKFSQADASDTRQKGGTGLGLAITKELMERMGGQIGFDSPPGQGACFWIELAVQEHP